MEWFESEPGPNIAAADPAAQDAAVRASTETLRDIAAALAPEKRARFYELAQAQTLGQASAVRQPRRSAPTQGVARRRAAWTRCLGSVRVESQGFPGGEGHRTAGFERQGRAEVYDCVAVTAGFAAFWGLGERPANKRRQRTERQRDGG